MPSIITNVSRKVVLSRTFQERCRTERQLPSSPDKIKYDKYFLQELSKCQIAHSDLHLKGIIQNHSKVKNMHPTDSWGTPESRCTFLEEAYKRCRHICAESSKSYYLGSLLFSEQQKKAIWAIYAWGRALDDLVDGPSNKIYKMDSVLDRFEERLQDIFHGRPYNMLDAALTDTVQNYSMDIKPFMDMIEGMRMDLWKVRYENFQELYQYCYYVAGTVALMTIPVFGIPSESHFKIQSIYRGALYYGIANQLTNVLRDVGEDATRGRVYLPQDELERFGLSDKDVFSRKVSDKWREFMKFQIGRARFYYSIAEEGAVHIGKANFWRILAAMLLYQKILDEIENNDYDNLTRKASVGWGKKLLILPLGYTRGVFTA